MMAISLSDILYALQNGVVAINNLQTTLAKIFPQATAVSSIAGSDGTVTFNSSLASTFITVVTSSGGQYKIAAYPSS